MGTLFRYISDSIAETARSGPCQLCGSQSSLFPIEAATDTDEWTISSDYTEELCADCIRRLPLRRFLVRPGERIVQQFVNQQFPKGTLAPDQRVGKMVSICDEYRRTPTFPLFLQGENWPHCCGDFCEYLGHPATYDEAIRIGREGRCWEGDFEELYGDMTLQPESLREVCLFKCLTCVKEVFTWQCT